jgi:hypothetical protein
MSGVTNRGKYLMLLEYFRNPAEVTNLYVALFTSAGVPTVDTNVFSELTEIAAGNGYTTGGIALSRNATDFDVASEDDSGDLAKIQVRDLAWTAAGGSLPASGAGARYACLTTDEATVANRQVIAFWDLVSDRTVSVGQVLTLQDCEVRATE